MEFPGLKEGEYMTKDQYLGLMGCQCDLLPLLFDPPADCGGFDDFMEGNCNSAGLAMFEMNDCDCLDADGEMTEECWSGEYGGCPEELVTPMTKEKVRTEVAERTGLEC